MVRRGPYRGLGWTELLFLKTHLLSKLQTVSKAMGTTFLHGLRGLRWYLPCPVSICFLHQIGNVRVSLCDFSTWRVIWRSMWAIVQALSSSENLHSWASLLYIDILAPVANSRVTCNNVWRFALRSRTFWISLSGGPSFQFSLRTSKMQWGFHAYSD